jgi:transposase-like protein
MLRVKRDVSAAQAFFSRSIKHLGEPPETIMRDGYAATHWAVCEVIADALLLEGTHVHSSKYLINVIEQDHRNIKSRTNVMLGFKRFRCAKTTISGIELMHRIRKGQFNLRILGLKDTTAPVVWNAVLSINMSSLCIEDISASPAICTRTRLRAMPSGADRLV